MNAVETNVPIDDLYPGDFVEVKFFNIDGVEFTARGRFCYLRCCSGCGGPRTWFVILTGKIDVIATQRIATITRRQRNAAAREEAKS